jgi:4-amino-4-deoxy-L-arabinose transferase-like glycosyltransferase
MTKRRTDRADKPRPSRATRSTREFVLFCCAAVAVCLMLKCPSLMYPRTEGDERIYWQLAQNLAANGEYSLRGSPILRDVSRDMYDRPLFHHPPLFPALLSLFARADLEDAAVLVSWLGHALLVLAVAIAGWHTLGRGAADRSIQSPAFWLPVLGVVADPLLMFVSRRIWIDSLLSGLVALSVAMLVSVEGAEGGRRRMLLAAAGGLLGLAGLAKLTALVLLPVFALVCVRDEDTWSGRIASIALVLGAAGLFVIPWLVVFYLQYGVLVPSWVKPDARLMELYPFVRAAVERPWYYYAVKLVLVMPLALVAVWALVRERPLWTSRTVQIAVLWFGTIVVMLTWLGMGGYGFQMRHIAPAIGGLYVAVLVLLIDRERPLLQMVCSFAMLVGTVTGAMHLLAPQFDEIVSLARVAGLLAY